MTPTAVPHAWTGSQGQRIKLLDAKPVGTLLVHEIYASIQGESTYSGLACTFVRLTGCPLRCRWCDTPHAFVEGSPMAIGDIVSRVETMTPHLIEVTGGEPLAHEECPVLLTALADTGRKVLLETSGAAPINLVDPRVTIIMDLKCPASGEESSNWYTNVALLRPTDEIKFVIADRADFDWSVRTIHEYGLTGHPILFSPVWGEMPYADLARWIVESATNVRLQLQMHKHIWDPMARGV